MREGSRGVASSFASAGRPTAAFILLLAVLSQQSSAVEGDSVKSTPLQPLLLEEIEASSAVALEGASEAKVLEDHARRSLARSSSELPTPVPNATAGRDAATESSIADTSEKDEDDEGENGTDADIPNLPISPLQSRTLKLTQSGETKPQIPIVSAPVVANAQSTETTRTTPTASARMSYVDGPPGLFLDDVVAPSWYDQRRPVTVTVTTTMSRTPSCHVKCEMGGVVSTCRDHTVWGAEHVHKVNPTPCLASLHVVHEQCPECADCLVEDIRACDPKPAKPVLDAIFMYVQEGGSSLAASTTVRCGCFALACGLVLVIGLHVRGSARTAWRREEPRLLVPYPNLADGGPSDGRRSLKIWYVPAGDGAIE